MNDNKKLINNMKEEILEKYQNLFKRLARRKFPLRDSISQFIKSITSELCTKDLYFFCYKMRRIVSFFSFQFESKLNFQF